MNKRKNVMNNNGRWKGDKVGYNGLHSWIRNNKPKSMFCEKCGKITNILDASSINHTYERNISKWVWLCKKCHAIERKRDFCKRGHELKGSNIYYDKNGLRSCLICRAITWKSWIDINKEYRKEYRKIYNKNPEEAETIFGVIWAYMWMIVNIVKLYVVEDK